MQAHLGESESVVFCPRENLCELVMSSRDLEEYY